MVATVPVIFAGSQNREWTVSGASDDANCINASRSVDSRHSESEKAIVCSKENLSLWSRLVHGEKSPSLIPFGNQAPMERPVMSGEEMKGRVYFFYSRSVE
jgi:hypothetical protein